MFNRKFPNKPKPMESLLNLLKGEGAFSSESVYNAMIQVDRGDFCDEDPYYDRYKKLI
jgi:hypothetical protein